MSDSIQVDPLLLGELNQSVKSLTSRMKLSDEMHKEHHDAAHRERELTRKEIAAAEDRGRRSVEELEKKMEEHIKPLQNKINRLIWVVGVLVVLSAADNPKIAMAFIEIVKAFH